MALLAPGGFVAGYLAGRAVGRAVSGCPLSGLCAETTPILLTLLSSIVGMGVASMLVATRVRLWWEGVCVWAAGILATFCLLVLVGMLGTDSVPGRVVSVAWLIAAIAVAVVSGRPRIVSNQ
ncbi:MAG: hypothetical protein AMS21_11795 [Gemmatimonas sp. SG8_38_2]|nr:MAG: hypothetical protein AMS21_11795 [Gemmatimonas sp. SG8_38_2]